MTEWWQTLPETLDRVWQLLGRGVADRRSAARHPVLATTGAGGAEARVVVLRGADRAAGLLRAYADLRSAKVTELRADPRATLLVWDAGAHLQMRLRVTVTVFPGSAADWARVPPVSARVYGAKPAPGLPVASPETVAFTPDGAMFGVLECSLRGIETLHLGEDIHRRALFMPQNGWRGGWLSP